MCLFGGSFDFQTGGGRASRMHKRWESSSVISKNHDENFRLRGGLPAGLSAPFFESHANKTAAGLLRRPLLEC
jgi:hypothetical protein